jgi:hypothetical protein
MGTATKQRQPVSILVAPPVKVSQANLRRPHFEIQIAADPTDVKRLITCSIVRGDEQAYRSSEPFNIVVYTSRDGGLSWEPTYELKKQGYNTDPTCAFGPDGIAYFMSFGGDLGYHFTEPMYRSIDGAKTWNQAAVLDIPTDREYITVDDTTGRFRGRVYVHGIGNSSIGIGVPGIDGAVIVGVNIFRSTDRFETYNSTGLASEGSRWIIEDGNGIVMLDGTFATIFGDGLDPQNTGVMYDLHPEAPNAKVKFISSADGGKTFGKATVISDWYLRFNGTLSGMPSLAVDRTAGPFRDRIYAAWVDARFGRGEIRLARSDDKGRTWSPSFVISDNWAHDARGETPDAFMPMLAVNPRGVVGVMWYDRRDHPDNLGYDVRFSASLDGGETFSPSVLVSRGGGSVLQMKAFSLSGDQNFVPSSEERSAGRTHARFEWFWHDNGGDTAGLTCDTYGVFHPLWIDRRSGLQQISTTRVTVNGAAMLNGGGGLEALHDLSTRAKLRYGLPDVDNSTNMITIGAVIVNTSKEPLPSRLTARLVGLESSNGRIEVQNADNGGASTGAVWVFHTPSGQLLQPGSLTAPRQLRFKLAHSLFAAPPLSFDSQRAPVELYTKILGK